MLSLSVGLHFQSLCHYVANCAQCLSEHFEDHIFSTPLLSAEIKLAACLESMVMFSGSSGAVSVLRVVKFLADCLTRQTFQ